MLETVLIAISILLIMVCLVQNGTINNLRFEKEKLKDLHCKEKEKLISMISWFSSYRIKETGEIELINIKDENKLNEINLN
jgi:hypothetical protein